MIKKKKKKLKLVGEEGRGRSWLGLLAMERTSDFSSVCSETQMKVV